jgi:hypothetical protein
MIAERFVIGPIAWNPVIFEFSLMVHNLFEKPLPYLVSFCVQPDGSQSVLHTAALSRAWAIRPGLSRTLTP